MHHLVLHPHTKQHIDNIVIRPTHAVLIAGPKGSGKSTLASELTASILGISADKLFSYPYYRFIAANGAAISIEQIRSLNEFLRLRTTGTRPFRRAVVLDDAHQLTTEAQNAFLKLLEEPPSDTILVLTAEGETSLLPTIYSRLQKISVKPAARQELASFFMKQGHSPDTVARAFYLSDGRPGLMHALLHNAADHPLVPQIAQAKSLLTKPLFERLAMVEALSKQKEVLPDFLLALERISHAAMTQAAEKDKQAETRKWQASLKKILWAREQLSRNPQSKLLLTDLLMTL